MAGDRESAIAMADRAVVLNPNSSNAWFNRGWVYRIAGLGEEAILEYADRGIRLGPRDPQTSIFLLIKGWAYMMLEQDEESLTWFHREQWNYVPDDNAAFLKSQLRFKSGRRKAGMPER